MGPSAALTLWSFASMPPASKQSQLLAWRTNINNSIIFVTTSFEAVDSCRNNSTDAAQIVHELFGSWLWIYLAVLILIILLIDKRA